MTTPNPTVKTLQAAIDDLKEGQRQHGLQISGLAGRMDGFEARIDARMKTYEQQASENTELLKEVKHATDFIKSSLKIIKWVAGIAMTVFLGQAAIYLWHLLVH